jgi:hypothetical protein
MEKPLVKGTALALILALGVCLAGVAAAQQPTRWTDVPPGTATGDSAPGRAPSAPTQTLTFYTDRATFQAENPALALENFALTSVPAGAITACDGPFNSATNNACFSTGTILDGVEVDNLGAVGSDQNVVIGVGALGNTDVLVGPNTFLTDGVIRHPDPAVPVYASGWDFVCPNGALTVNIDIYDTTGALLGSDSSPCGATGNFWGVGADVQIGWIETFEPGGGELYANVEFGTGAVPTMSEWGLILLATILLGISMIFVLRRRNA